MWGFVEDPGGTCYTDPGGAAGRLACANALPDPTVPGPQLTADPGIGGAVKTLRIFLTNALTVETSIIIPGQEMPFSSNNNGPTWDNNQKGARGANLTKRVRSFGREAAANGGVQRYIWNGNRNNPFQPGTFLYQSGTNPALQVHMGLYGAVTKDYKVGEAYEGISYDAEVVLLYSEIDPALHDPPANAKPLNYKPTWFLVNGEPYEDGVTPPESAGNTSGTTLIRFLNAGLKAHAPTLVNGPHMSVIAEDGHPLLYGREQYSVRLGPGKTSDALWNPTADGQYPIYDRTLQLTNAGVTGGGMLSYLDVGTDGGPIAVDDPEPPADYSVAEDDPAGLTVNAASGVLANDTGPAGAGDPLPAGSEASLVTGTGSGALALNPDGSFTYEPLPDFNGQDSFTYRVINGTDSNVATAIITVTPDNDAPVANDDAASTDDNTPVTIDVLANDTDADGDTLSVSSFTDGTSGTVTLHVSGGLTYTPTALGEYVDTFTYDATDATDVSNTATVTVTVTAAANQPPVAVNDSGSTTACNDDTILCSSVTILIDVLANDSDPDGDLVPDSVCLRFFNYPVRCAIPDRTTKNGGSVTNNYNGTVTYTPPVGFLGTDNFRYSVEDDDGDVSNRAKVRVNVVQ
jgi:FtsP/CotA-like multicopper oxidase with cupredoxin domain